MISDNSYKNPFADYNANILDSQQILNFWCSPFAYARFAGVSESDIFRDKGAIVFFGGEGPERQCFLGTARIVCSATWL